MKELPWRWYCRICGDKDDAPTREARDEMAAAHLRLTDCGCHPNIGRVEQRRLLHVWTYRTLAAMLAALALVGVGGCRVRHACPPTTCYVHTQPVEENP